MPPPHLIFKCAPALKYLRNAEYSKEGNKVGHNRLYKNKHFPRLQSPIHIPEKIYPVTVYTMANE